MEGQAGCAASLRVFAVVTMEYLDERAYWAPWLFHVHRCDLLVGQRQHLSVGIRSLDIGFVADEIGAQQDALARRRADGDEGMMPLDLGERFLQLLPLADIHPAITAKG